MVVVQAMDELQEMYLGLLKKCLSFSLWDETLYFPYHLGMAMPPKDLIDLDRRLREVGYCLAREYPYRPDVPLEGADITYLGHTMIGFKRLDNFQFCIEQTIKDAVPGDIVETGVWRGGACILASNWSCAI